MITGDCYQIRINFFDSFNPISHFRNIRIGFYTCKAFLLFVYYFRKTYNVITNIRMNFFNYTTGDLLNCA